MPSSGRPSFADARLLETLERAFAHHAGADAVIDAGELQRALGLKSIYLAQRVLAGFDRNGDSVIQKDEFLSGVRDLVFGTDREKLAFAFRVHDHDGDGSIDPKELYRMIAISLAENDVAARASQPPERLANALFLKADTNRDGKISFEEFAAVVRTRPALLKQMTRCEAAWIAPNEALLDWLDGGEGERPGRVARFFENRLRSTVLLVLWIVANVAVFESAMLRGLRGQRPDALMQAGRALGACIDLNGALILIPMMRRLLTWLRPTWVGRAIPVDHAVTFHKVVGHTMFGLALAHGTAFALSFASGHPKSALFWLFVTERGLTGSVLLVVFGIMWAFSLGAIRRSSRFELFYFTHLLYVVWFVLAIVHAPPFLFVAGVPLLGFVVEEVLRARRRGPATSIISSQALRSGVTRLELERPPGFTFAAGDYVFLRIPEIARHEWHPFTLSSAPERSALTVHIRSLGNWTSALRRRVEERHTRGAEAPMTAYVDGPYGSPSGHIFASKNAVFIGAGIGVTPFASVLESLVLRANGNHPPALEKAHFFWLNRDQYSFE
ncbi:MAG TPA: EF-hand domain-containing protein, partial [Polyangiaceae bacterium]